MKNSQVCPNEVNAKASRAARLKCSRVVSGRYLRYSEMCGVWGVWCDAVIVALCGVWCVVCGVWCGAVIIALCGPVVCGEVVYYVVTCSWRCVHQLESIGFAIFGQVVLALRYYKLHFNLVLILTYYLNPFT